MKTEELQTLLDTMDNGILRRGAHKAGGREFCALEFESQVRGRAWSDDPVTLPDLRPLNDACWSSDKVRTAALLPVMAAMWDWANWSTARRTRWAELVAIRSVQQMVSELPGLPDDIRAVCRAADTCNKAWAAAEAAARAAWAAEAAWAAAWEKFDPCALLQRLIEVGAEK